MADPIIGHILRGTHNIQDLFPMQEQCASYIHQVALSNIASDVCIASPTGTGKTLCYVIPIVKYLVTHMASRVLCVVLLPTKDTAQEVFNVFYSLTAQTPLHVALICGSLSLEAEHSLLQREINGIKVCCAHIVIGTPRRILEHVDLNPLLFTSVRFLAIDEADILLGPSNNDWIYRFLDATMKDRQNQCVLHKILCSATLTSSLPLYVHLGMSNVVSFQHQHQDAGVDPQQLEDMFALPETLQEFMVDVAEEDKLRTLVCILEEAEIRQPTSTQVVLIFCSSVVRTHRIHRFLSITGYSSCEFSRNLSHRERLSNMNALLLHSKANVIVATDVLGRGVDFSQKITLVIQYDTPTDAKSYLHRCGRTARAGRSGMALTLVDPACTDFMKHIRAQLLPTRALSRKEYDHSGLPSGRIEKALISLSKVLAMEEQRTLQTTDAVPVTQMVDIFKKTITVTVLNAVKDTPSVVTSQRTKAEKIDFHWICSMCRFTNTPNNNVKCYRCGTVRTGGEKKHTGTIEKATHGGEWKCGGCGHRSLPRDLTCGKCQKRRTVYDQILFEEPAVKRSSSSAKKNKGGERNDDGLDKNKSIMPQRGSDRTHNGDDEPSKRRKSGN